MICKQQRLYYFRGMEAHHENRIYYFHLESRKEHEIKITMYGSPYTFIKSGETWINYPSNIMEMKKGLVAAVMLAIGEI